MHRHDAGHVLYPRALKLRSIHRSFNQCFFVPGNDDFAQVLVTKSSMPPPLRRRSRQENRSPSQNTMDPGGTLTKKIRRRTLIEATAGRQAGSQKCFDVDLKK